jgi:hypothetical protein
MKGLGIAALFAFVSFILSYGLFLPSDLKSFSLIAAIASMAGYFLGEQSTHIAFRFVKILLVIIMTAICAVCIVWYILFIQQRSGDTSDVKTLAILLFCIFFSFTFVMPMAGVSFQRS